MAEQHLLPNEIDYTKFQFGFPKTRSTGGTSIRLQYNHEDFVVEFGRVSAPFGVRENVIQRSDGSEGVYYTITLSLDGYRTNNSDPKSPPTRPKALDMFNTLNKMESMLLEKVQENCEEWMGDSDLKDPDLAKDFIRPLMNVSMNPDGTPKDYAPLVKLYFKVYDGKLNSKVYIHNQKNIVTNIRDLLKLVDGRSECCVIAKCDRLTMAQGKVGYKLFVEQIKFYLKGKPMSDYSFEITDEFEE